MPIIEIIRAIMTPAINDLTINLLPPSKDYFRD